MMYNSSVCNLIFLQQCCWEFRLREMWHYSDGFVVPGVLKKHTDFKTPGTTNPSAQHNIPEEDLNFSGRSFLTL